MVRSVMNKINLTKLKADAEERLSDENPKAAMMTHKEGQALETTLTLIEAVKRAAFTLNELCACDVDTDRCEACRTLDFMREQIDFGGA